MQVGRVMTMAPSYRRAQASSWWIMLCLAAVGCRHLVSFDQPGSAGHSAVRDASGREPAIARNPDAAVEIPPPAPSFLSPRIPADARCPRPCDRAASALACGSPGAAFEFDEDA